MSYTTRCPACGTMFKVVPDQLKISDGWVRCGHCADVFDATLYLEAWVPPTPAPVPPPLPEPEPTRVPVPEPVAESRMRDAAPEAAWAPVAAEFSSPDELVPEPSWTAEERAVEAPSTRLAPSPEPEVAAHTGELSDWLVSPESASDGRELEPIAKAVPGFAPVPALLASDPPALPAAAADKPAQPEPEPEPDFQAELERFAAVSSGAVRLISADASSLEPGVSEPAFTEPDADGALHDGDGDLHDDEPGFVRQAKQRAFWRSPGVRAALGVLTLFLSVLLAAQWALHERDQLAASHPDLAPLLARLCEPLGCEVGPVRRIDAVEIDSSTLVRRLGNFYSFDLVLKNTAAMPVAVPALELSLTDTRDSVIARRVFLPEELPDTPRLLPAQSTLSVSLRLSIADGGAVPMAGYRALVFYP
jgi:predicted Zn finger-like uncharacterized protein